MRCDGLAHNLQGARLLARLVECFVREGLRGDEFQPTLNFRAKSFNSRDLEMREHSFLQLQEDGDTDAENGRDKFGRGDANQMTESYCCVCTVEVELSTCSFQCGDETDEG